MRAAFAAQLEFPRLLRVEENHGFDTHAAVLGAAKAHHIDARFPRHLSRGAAQCHQRIGKTRAVHMDGQVVFLGHRGQRPQLFKAVHPAAFRHLRDRHRSALRRVHVARHPRDDGPAQGLWGHLVFGLYQRQLGRPGVELGRVALILFDMRDLGAKDRLPRLGVAGQRQRIGRGAGGNEVDLGLWRLELLPDLVADLIHDRVFAVGHRVVRIGGDHALHHLGVDGAGVVRGEKHQVGSSIIWSSHSSNGVSNSDTVSNCTLTPASCTLSGVLVSRGCHSGSGLPSHSRR